MIYLFYLVLWHYVPFQLITSKWHQLCAVSFQHLVKFVQLQNYKLQNYDYKLQTIQIESLYCAGVQFCCLSPTPPRGPCTQVGMFPPTHSPPPMHSPCPPFCFSWSRLHGLGSFVLSHVFPFLVVSQGCLTNCLYVCESLNFHYIFFYNFCFAYTNTEIQRQSSLR